MLFVGNHLSYLDIPVLLSQSPVAFVAKKQIGTWPIFGDACRTIGVVLVDRQSKDSREKTSGQIADAVRNRRQSVAVFPSGTTCLDETKPWRWGVFKIAKDYGIPLRPFRLKYTPRESTAFVGDSYFVPHLWTLLDEPKITATIEFHDPVMVYEPEAEANKWWAWTRGFN